MRSVVTSEEMRAYEQALFSSGAETGESLMERAAEGVAAYILQHPRTGRVLLVCGCGNNGGDGLAALRLLHQAGRNALGILVGDPNRLKGDALLNYRRALDAGCRIEPGFPDTLPTDVGWLVDALFGTGLNRTVTGASAYAVQAMNASDAPILSVDIPSGVDASTGEILGEAVRADVTVTFQFPKRGHLLFPGRERTGMLVIHPLTDNKGDTGVCWQDGADIRTLLSDRPLSSHKGMYGRALLCVGSTAYTGAALLSASAALRTGCGVLEAAVPRAVKSAFTALPEVCCTPVGMGGSWDDAALKEAAARIPGKQALGIGSGMGELENSSLLEAALLAHIPLVLDADALNHMARHPDLLNALHGKVVLTPHPLEMSRLTGLSVLEITRDPIAIAKTYSAKWHCVVLLKGATTCISDGANVYLNTTGNPGLSKGGSGDVLTGIITGLLAQGLSPLDGARAGAYLLGVSAVEALELLKTRALTAGDVIDAIRASIRTEE